MTLRLVVSSDREILLVVLYWYIRLFSRVIFSP